MNPSRLLATLALASCSLFAVTAAASAPPPSLIPAPQTYTAGAGAFAVTARTRIAVPRGDAGAEQAARFLADVLSRTRGLRPAVVQEGTRGAGRAIHLRHAPAPGAPDSYRLSISPAGIDIVASDAGGLLYGSATLWQLITADDARGPATLAAAEITDAPRFPWRGFMLDSCRHYQSPAFIRALIDWMALHKLNVLHWHLTDDQAWRLEIKAYPKLTEVGGWRVPAGEGPAHDIDPATGRPRREGGIYTQEEVRRLVAYAGARNITIVPEIEMPGHATAAIAAYPELASTPAPPREASSDWGVFPNLYNPADPHTFTFLETVLGETMALFPSRFIHVGGDEAVKDQWNASPAIQAQIRALGLKDADALQSWFTQRIEAYLNAHGRRLIGWDEILQGGLPPNATVMSWRGIDGAITAAKAGHDTVLAPAPMLYLDNRQGPAPDEPSGRGTVISLQTVYDFDPEPAQLSAAERRHILGVQANLWTEHVRTEAQAQWMILPRLAALSEVAWSPADRRDWGDFLHRLPGELARDRSLGLKPSDTAFRVQVSQDTGDTPNQGRLKLANQAGFGEIHYTLDGQPVTAASPVYQDPLSVALPAELRSASFDGPSLISAETRTSIDALSVRHRFSQELKLCEDGTALNLEDDAPGPDGRRAVMLTDIMQPCWIYLQADLGGAASLSVGVSKLPFNFQIGAQRDHIRLPTPSTAEGELEVRLDSCNGERLALLPLAPADRNSAVTTLRVALPPRTGRHDLCLRFNRPSVDPLWALNWVQLVPAGQTAADASPATQVRTTASSSSSSTKSAS